MLRAWSQPHQESAEKQTKTRTRRSWQHLHRSRILESAEQHHRATALRWTQRYPGERAARAQQGLCRTPREVHQTTATNHLFLLLQIQESAGKVLSQSGKRSGKRARLRDG
jgi:hypothetical protein